MWLKIQYVKWMSMRRRQSSSQNTMARHTISVPPAASQPSTRTPQNTSSELMIRDFSNYPPFNLAFTRKSLFFEAERELSPTASILDTWCSTVSIAFSTSQL
jgi:hypothetical protein